MFSFMIISADGDHATRVRRWTGRPSTRSRASSRCAAPRGRHAGVRRVTYQLMAALADAAGQESDPDVAKATNTHPQDRISRTLPQATWA